MKIPPKYPFYQSLRFRFGLLFGLIFFFVLVVFGYVFYEKIRHELEANFSNQLQSGAQLVLQKTSVNPLVIPLPQNHETFLLIYSGDTGNDTIFSNLPKEKVRVTNESRSLETGGRLSIRYALDDSGLMASLRSWQRLLFIYLPMAFLCSLILGYTLSGLLLRPIRQLSKKASQIDLQNDVRLLTGPKNEDEIHLLTEALNRMLEKIRFQLGEQNAFFASASHELRTPLSNMLTELQVLETSGLPEDLKIVVQNQKGEVLRMIKLVNDFLLMSQLKADAVRLNRKKFDLLEMVMDSVARFNNSALAEGLHFRMAVKPVESEFTIVADREHMETVLNNLFSNAVKYARSETSIEVELIRRENSIVLALGNETGKSVAAPGLLGQQFYREDFYKEGFGLGLWIVRQLMDRNGGKFEISSGRGRFVVKLEFLLMQAVER